MKSIDYPEATIAVAKDQPQYNTLYAFIGNTAERQTVVCMELTEQELKEINENKKLWYMQCTHGNLFQPMSIHTKNPFSRPISNFVPPVDENRVPAAEWDKTHFADPLSQSRCMNCQKAWSDHYFTTRQCFLHTANHDNIQSLLKKGDFPDALLLIMFEQKDIRMNELFWMQLFNDEVTQAGLVAFDKGSFDHFKQVLIDKKYISPS